MSNRLISRPPRRGRGLTALAALFFPAVFGCGAVPIPPAPANRFTEPIDPERYELAARFVHISDAHMVDEESPGRLTFFAGLNSSAWRPQEAYSTQILDGTIRTVNKLHVSRSRFDFLIHTGDVCDNAQQNEVDWFLTVMNGGLVTPLTGTDDRDPADRPPPHLDPHEPFQAQGLYRQGVHGDAPSIPWYNVFGNHDRFALGVFPIIEDLFGVLIAPLPLENRIGFFAPKYLDPVGRLSWSIISPAVPGPPYQLTIPRPVTANRDRQFFTSHRFIRAHLESEGLPSGHGFDAAQPTRSWYSVSPKPGLRLIVLNSASPRFEIPSLVYSDGAISAEQRDFLIDELENAQAADEIVIVATHHPSAGLEPAIGTSVTMPQFRSLLKRYPAVKLHLAGHLHTNAEFDHGGYFEVVTGSTLDFPQQGRIIEIWRPRLFDGQEDPGDRNDQVEIRMSFFAHHERINPPGESYRELFDDPLFEMRRTAAELAGLAFEPSD